MRSTAANLNDFNVNLHDQEIDCRSVRFDASTGIATIDVWVEADSRDRLTTPIRLPLLGLTVAYRTIRSGRRRRYIFRLAKVTKLEVENPENLDWAMAGGLSLSRDGRLVRLDCHMPFSVVFEVAGLEVDFEETDEFREPGADADSLETISFARPVAVPLPPPPSS